MPEETKGLTKDEFLELSREISRVKGHTRSLIFAYLAYLTGTSPEKAREDGGISFDPASLSPEIQRKFYDKSLAVIKAVSTVESVNQRRSELQDQLDRKSGRKRSRT